jgi:hypothetical protein
MAWSFDMGSFVIGVAATFGISALASIVAAGVLSRPRRQPCGKRRCPKEGCDSYLCCAVKIDC